MLEFKDYIAGWPGVPHADFSHWLEDSVRRWKGKTALFYRSGGDKGFTRWSYAFPARNAAG